MLETYQKTLSNTVKLQGTGLHSGEKSTVNIFPAPEDHGGVVFKRTDLKNNNLIKANLKMFHQQSYARLLENNYGVKVSTVEHLLAAFTYMESITL